MSNNAAKVQIDKHSCQELHTITKIHH